MVLYITIKNIFELSEKNNKIRIDNGLDKVHYTWDG